MQVAKAVEAAAASGRGKEAASQCVARSHGSSREASAARRGAAGGRRPGASALGPRPSARGGVVRAASVSVANPSWCLRLCLRVPLWAVSLGFCASRCSASWRASRHARTAPVVTMSIDLCPPARAISHSSFPAGLIPSSTVHFLRSSNRAASTSPVYLPPVPNKSALPLKRAPRRLPAPTAAASTSFITSSGANPQHAPLLFVDGHSAYMRAHGTGRSATSCRGWAPHSIGHPN